MKKLLTFWLFTGLLVSASNAQDQTLRNQDSPTDRIERSGFLNNNPKSILVVPFKGNMYLSNVDRELAAGSNLNQEQVQQKIREALCYKIASNIESKYKAFSFLNTDTATQRNNIDRIYSSLKYVYKEVKDDVIEEEVGENTSLLKNNPFKKFQKKEEIKEEETSPQGHGMRGGQIVTSNKHVKKYTHAELSKKEIIPFLVSQYDSKYIVLINQVNLNYSSTSDQYTIGGDSYKRKIVVHFTLYNNKGEMIYSGTESQQFSKEINDVNILIQEVFPSLSRQINSHLPVETEEENAEFQEERLEK